MKKLVLAVGMLALTTSAFARERAAGYCNQGGHVVITQGLQSTNDVQESYPSCTVTVYINGTTTLASIYADNLGTVKGNPFTSDANGYWFFYANNGRYDVHFSNSTIANPYTQGDYLLCDPADPSGLFSCGGGSGGPHNLLSTTHLDTIPASPPTRGALITGQNLTSPTGVTPAWAELTLGPNTYVLTSNGTDAIWAPVPGGGGCLAGASDTRYVDSASGNDSNSGLNWCSAYATEQTAVTALTGTGGWVYEAPHYTGASASSVPTNIHILRTNQFDAFRSSVQRYSYPDWTDVTEDHHAFASNSGGTMADAHTAYTTLGPFGGFALTSSVLGNLTVPSGAAQSHSEQAGVAGIVTNNSNLDLMQSDGVYGACYNVLATGLDCSGIVGVVGNSNSASSNGSFEAMWANITLKADVTDAMGLVIRANGGHMPNTQIGSNSGRPNSAIDVTYGGATPPGDSFYTGLFFESSAVGQVDLAFTGNGVTNQPHTNVFTYDRWDDYYNGGNNNVFSVIKLNNTLSSQAGAYQAGNYIFKNSANTSEVVLPVNYTGTVKTEGLSTVTFSATPTFDRSLGSVQKIVLTGNVTSSTFQNCVAGQTVIFDIVEDGTGGHTFVAPANLHLFGAIDTTANSHNVQTFYCDGTSTLSGGYATGVMVSGL